MDYLKVYHRIVERARSQDRSKKGSIYYESHHIVPKCIGGSNKKSNLVLLTAKEHYICHALLFKANPESRKLAHAFYLMCNFSEEGERYYRISSRLYEEVKIVYANYRSVKQKEDINKYWTEERKQERAIKYSGKGNPNYGKIGGMAGKRHTKESIEKFSSKTRGRKKTPEHVAKVVEGKRKSGAYKKLSERLKKPIQDIRSGIIYLSRSEAALLLNCNLSTIDEKRKKGIFKYI